MYPGFLVSGFVNIQVIVLVLHSQLIVNRHTYEKELNLLAAIVPVSAVLKNITSY